MFTTITLNPALDKIVSTEQIQIGEVNRVVCKNASPAGKGIDVAKVLRDLGCHVAGSGFLGGSVAPVFTSFFHEEGIEDYFVPIAGATRTNLQIFDSQNRRTELLERGPRVSDEECEQLLKTAQTLFAKSRVVTLCGSAPSGVDATYFCRLIRMAKEAGALVIVDTSGEFLAASLKEKPHLIKPNQYEMAALMGAAAREPETLTRQQVMEYARKIVQDGVAYVMVSLGRDGAMLVCPQGAWLSRAPDVPVKSTLGCGDTMVASLAVSLKEGLHPEQMLVDSVALSSANAMTFETAHISLEDYKEILTRTTAEQIAAF